MLIANESQIIFKRDSTTTTIMYLIQVNKAGYTKMLNSYSAGPYNTCSMLVDSYVTSPKKITRVIFLGLVT